MDTKLLHDLQNWAYMLGQGLPKLPPTAQEAYDREERPRRDAVILAQFQARLHRRITMLEQLKGQIERQMEARLIRQLLADCMNNNKEVVTAYENSTYRSEK